MNILTNKEIEDLRHVIDILSQLPEEFIVPVEDFKITIEKSHNEDQEIEDIERTVKSLEKHVK